MAAGLRSADRREELPLADGGRARSTCCSPRARAAATRRGSRVRSATRSTPTGACCRRHRRDRDGPRQRARARRAQRPAASQTRGTGELLLEAAEARRHERDRRARRLGSTDGGLGALEALGFKFPFPSTSPATSRRATSTPRSSVRRRAQRRGHRDARDASSARRATRRGRPQRWRRGPGGRGGLASLGADLRSGFDVVAEAVGLQERLAQASIWWSPARASSTRRASNGKSSGALFNAPRAKAVIAG